MARQPPRAAGFQKRQMLVALAVHSRVRTHGSQASMSLLVFRRSIGITIKGYHDGGLVTPQYLIYTAALHVLGRLGPHRIGLPRRLWDLFN